MVLQIENLTFGWQTEPLFENICGHLDEKEIVQLSGENGSGKTTLFQLIAGMIPHFRHGNILKGDVFINGHAILKQPPKNFFPTIAFIPSLNLEFFLLTESLRQEILLTRSILKINPHREKERLEQFSNFFPDINETINVPFKAMQFNHKIIALTFIFYLQNARLYLFDEVMKSFSESMIQQWYSFFEWLSSNGCAILFVNHNQQAEQFPQWFLSNKRLIRL